MRESAPATPISKAYLRPYPGDCDDTLLASAPIPSGVTRRQGQCGAGGPHKDGYNLLVADTHAKWYRPESSESWPSFPR